ncbi:GGDEF domain-containing protein [Spirulina sp. 06S082]|uniref:GGDEF domain-containing protein n=1 Tax=Spirulina sp. 06S082 TaxID=3110248 RepID=UPI002B20341D|nr:GGDEF domain-containing protein [Spirulina sp. 06S082]MEA5468944.1 GGDEF domain-containing protein [Spirulina sp. 06S082]
MLTLPALMPHGSCFFWNVPLTTLHVTADCLIFLAYFSIPTIMFINRNYATEKARSLLVLFAAFIFSCGLSHLVTAWNIWHTDYWLEGCTKLITALVSGYTAIELKRCLPNLLRTQQNLERSEELMRTDPLTGLVNRRGFQEAVTQLYNDDRDRKRIHTLILLDLDGFKNVNDTYGHPFGDRLLCQIGELLKMNVRSPESFVARIGGDEFAILLENCGIIEASNVAIRLRCLIAEFSLTKDNLGLGVSAGLSILASQKSLETVYEEADKALYYSKQAGKNLISWTDSLEKNQFKSI